MRKMKGETILNIVLIVAGVAMMGISVFCSAPKDSLCEKIIAMIGDLGVGLFPTGMIGILLSKAQDRENTRQQNARRRQVLSRIDSALHQYLVSVCKGIGTAAKGKSLEEIIELVTGVAITENEKLKLSMLVGRLEEYFDRPDPVFVMTDCFTETEQRFHTQRISEGKELLMSDEHEELQARKSFLEHWTTAFSDIPEYGYYKNLKFDGDNLV